MGHDVTKALKDFFASVKLLNQVKSTSLTIIPKTNTPETLNYFGPISCCPIIYKIITKVLSFRMSKVLPRLIRKNQFAFVARRSIVDNILLAHEIFRN